MAYAMNKTKSIDASYQLNTINIAIETKRCFRDERI